MLTCIHGSSRKFDSVQLRTLDMFTCPQGADRAPGAARRCRAARGPSPPRRGSAVGPCGEAEARRPGPATRAIGGLVCTCTHVRTALSGAGSGVCTRVHAGGWGVPSRWQSRTRGPCGPSVCTCTHVHTTCRPISKPSLLVEEPEQPLPRTAPADAKDGRRALLGEMRNSATEGGSSGIDPTCWRPRVCRVCPRMSCAAPWTQARGKARIDSPR